MNIDLCMFFQDVFMFSYNCQLNYLFWSISWPVLLPTDAESWRTETDSSHPVPPPSPPVPVRRPTVQPRASSTLQALLRLGIQSISQPQTQSLCSTMIVKANSLFPFLLHGCAAREETWNPSTAKRGIETISVCMAANSIAYKANASTSRHMCWPMCLSTKPSMMHHTAANYNHQDSC